MKKMIVVMLKKTKGILAAVTRTSEGAPPVADLVGERMFVRRRNTAGIVQIDASEIEVKELDLEASVFLDPRQYVLDASETSVTQAAFKITQLTLVGGEIGVVLNTGTVPGGLPVVVAIESGAPAAALVLDGTTILNQATTKIPATSVPNGSWAVVASVKGFGMRMETMVF